MRYPDSSTSIWKRRQKFIPEEGNDPSAIKCTSFKKKLIHKNGKIPCKNRIFTNMPGLQKRTHIYSF